MRLCIFASILEPLALGPKLRQRLLLKVWITSKRKQLAYIRQGSTAESLAGLFLLRRFRLAACVAFLPGRPGPRPSSSAQRSSECWGSAANSCRITIWAVRRGPSFPARNTLSSTSTLSSSASKVQDVAARQHQASRRARRSVGSPSPTDADETAAYNRVSVPLIRAPRRRRKRVLRRRSWIRPARSSAPGDAPRRTARDKPLCDAVSNTAVGDRLAIAFHIVSGR